MARSRDSDNAEVIASAVNDAIDRIRATAEEAEARIREGTSDTGDLVKREARRLRAASREAGIAVRDQVQDHPVASAAALAAAVGAGLLLWGLLRRR